MSQIAINLFGSFSITVDEKPVTKLGLLKAQALLAYLASEQAPAYSRQALMSLLWSDSSAKQAGNGLRIALYRIREALGDVAPHARDELLSITRQTVRFHHESASIDVVEFQTHLDAVAVHDHPSLESCPTCLQHLTTAVSHYGGEFLAGLDVQDAQLFEEWLLVQRESLRQQVLVALTALIAAQEQMGDYALAHIHAVKQVQLDPYREEAHRQLMRILARQGLPEQAQSQFAQMQRLLAEELGVEPEPESAELLEQIRAGNFVERAAPLISSPPCIEGESVARADEASRLATGTVSPADKGRNGGGAEGAARVPASTLVLDTAAPRIAPTSAPPAPEPLADHARLSPPGMDWGDAPIMDAFFGRAYEVQRADPVAGQRWLPARCHLRNGRHGQDDPGCSRGEGPIQPGRTDRLAFAAQCTLATGVLTGAAPDPSRTIFERDAGHLG